MLIYRIFRNSFLIIFLVVFLSLGINSCGSSEKSSSDTSGSDSDTSESDSDTSESDSDSSPSSTVRTSLVSSGSSECLYGGVKIESGIDENKNGILDDSEVDKTLRFELLLQLYQRTIECYVFMQNRIHGPRNIVMVYRAEVSSNLVSRGWQVWD